ncbi:MAG: M23 family metallopeptidase, partial [Hoeflea sp.]|nr:M23 family metallopeptidase [Hoeflea sp.]
DHGNGLTTRYAHLSAVEVREGDRVGIGARIGKSGSTGRSTGPHLHYEVRRNGNAIDPMRFLKAAQKLKPLLVSN